MKRRDLLMKIRNLAVTASISSNLLPQITLAQNTKKPNVLFIAVDDLNDWIGCLGGHPQVKTLHIDKLASQGVLFKNAHCQSPVCNPSRASLMTSLYPSTTGIYFLDPGPGEAPVAKKNTFMLHRFQQEGYYTTGGGKLFHGHKQNKKHIPNYGGPFGGSGPRLKKKLSSFPGHLGWDWGVFPYADDKMPDYQLAEWSVKQLQKNIKEPFLLGVGFSRPHVPQYAPQKWFDLYPIETVKLPEIIEQDLKDISKYGINLTSLNHVSPTHQWVTENNEWKPLVQSYLACVSFVDAQIGKVLKALEKSPYKDNTYIVLWGDHGFHLGEKEHWAKRTLWEDGTRVPMIIAGPGIQKGKVCSKPVQLMDMYPTLLDLAGLKPDPLHEGHSLKPLLKDPGSDWLHYARTSYGPGNYSIRSERYRYIQYNDGSEEFYDLKKDPHEWNNLSKDPKMTKLIQKHKSFIPEKSHPVLGQNSTGHKAYDASEAIKNNIVMLGLDGYSLRNMRWKAMEHIKFAAEMKLDAVLFNNYNHYFKSLDSNYLKKVKKMADTHNIKIYIGAGGICKKVKSFSKKHNTAKEVLTEGIRIATALGSPVVNVRIGSYQDRYTEGGIKAYISEAVKVLKSMRSQAKKAQIKFAFENHAGDLRSEELLSLIKEVGTDICGVMFDPGNAVWAMEDPMKQIQILGTYILSTSVRDYMVWKSEEGATCQWTAIGDGLMDPVAFTRYMAKLCPGVPLFVETISNMPHSIPFETDEFWDGYPDLKRKIPTDFIELYKRGKPLQIIEPKPGMNGGTFKKEHQLSEFKKSIKYLHEKCNAGINHRT